MDMQKHNSKTQKNNSTCKHDNNLTNASNNLITLIKDLVNIKTPKPTSKASITEFQNPQIDVPNNSIRNSFARTARPTQTSPAKRQPSLTS